MQMIRCVLHAWFCTCMTCIAMKYLDTAVIWTLMKQTWLCVYSYDCVYVNDVLILSPVLWNCLWRLGLQQVCITTSSMCVWCKCLLFVSSILFSLASGDGGKILQFCPSFHIVQKMREGQTPKQACDSIVSNMKERSGNWFEVAVIALDTKVSNLFIPTRLQIIWSWRTMWMQRRCCMDLTICYWPPYQTTF